jgi:hypothetical protein
LPTGGLFDASRNAHEFGLYSHTLKCLYVTEKPPPRQIVTQPFEGHADAIEKILDQITPWKQRDSDFRSPAQPPTGHPLLARSAEAMKKIP